MAKTLAMVLGVVFIIVGVLGFIANPIVGMDGAIFETDMLHNVVHLLFGIILIVASKKSQAASSLWLTILGAVYLALAVLGFVATGEDELILGIVHANMADHWLHVVLGVVLIAVGILGKKSAPMAPSGPMM
jgi:hypothetical protein